MPSHPSASLRLTSRYTFSVSRKHESRIRPLVRGNDAVEFQRIGAGTARIVATSCLRRARVSARRYRGFIRCARIVVNSPNGKRILLRPAGKVTAFLPYSHDTAAVGYRLHGDSGHRRTMLASAETLPQALYGHEWESTGISDRDPPRIPNVAMNIVIILR